MSVLVSLCYLSRSSLLFECVRAIIHFFTTCSVMLHRIAQLEVNSRSDWLSKRVFSVELHLCMKRYC